ncbi:monovalent cation/H(+) antiporter subunit G [Methylocaldum sp.]|uniref:monovalent cation/H(+) antiporter subunit G n=1 Tax=Methylocaldum sp. TaxID=1969727 RepID=UPI002D6B05A2|nr:monovalent cation/H(+) antiporter subunit G [Methylocaldum sp.]HYE35917.1 monovalent cation/H(+) antiporter subunit G [Methylocaldum sp.]
MNEIALQWFSAFTLFLGVFFFFAGTVGLLRFPDVYTRIHALTKADNLGLGLVIFGLMLQAESWAVILKLLLIWLLALPASATACHLLARHALRSEQPPRTGAPARKESR